VVKEMHVKTGNNIRDNRKNCSMILLDSSFPFANLLGTQKEKAEDKKRTKQEASKGHESQGRVAG